MVEASASPNAAPWRASQPALPLRRPNATRTVAHVDPAPFGDHGQRQPFAVETTDAGGKGSVNLLGPFGPRLPGANPATPPASKSATHRHNVVVDTLNAAATATALAVFVRTNCTAATGDPPRHPPQR